jgi:hypothetical protein
MSLHPATLGAALISLALLASPRVAFADEQDAGADAAEGMSRTGRSRQSWPLLKGAEFDKSYADLARRYGVTPPPPDKRKADDADPTYEVYVPPDYAPGRPFGVLVWVAPSGDGGVAEAWTKVLDEHHLIWVGPNNIGNGVDVLRRTYMAIEAARQAKLRYTVDDERVYVGGMSGGGRVASHVALVAADTFAGGFYVVGCNFWKAVPAGEGKRIYPGFWRRPDLKLLKKARATGRYVLLTGSDDYNRVNTKCIYDGYVNDKFAHATYLEVPGMGHAHPDAAWFGKAVAALDEPLATPQELFERAVALEKKKKLGDACLDYGRAAVRGGAGEPFAEEAAEKAALLRKAYAQQVVRVRGWVEESNWSKAASENAILKAQYGPLAAAQSAAFAEEIKKGKAKRR